MKSKWNKYLRYGFWISLVGLFLFLTVATYLKDNMGFKGKTYWNWMEVLIIPLVLAFGAILLNNSQRNNELLIEKDRQQEAALQAYLDRMSELLLEKKLQTTKEKEVRDVARTLTLNVLRGLDGLRKKYVLEFLIDAILIGGVDQGEEKSPIIRLADADFRHADLRGVNLGMIDLQRTNLEHADFRGVYMFETNFYEANMRYVNLQGANPRMSFFQRTDLSYSNLRDAVFWDLTLDNTNLQFADLRGADFHHSAGLSNVDLTGANLKGANIPQGHLTAKSLKGAIMPDGKKHE